MTTDMVFNELPASFIERERQRFTAEFAACLRYEIGEIDADAAFFGWLLARREYAEQVLAEKRRAKEWKNRLLRPVPQQDITPEEARHRLKKLLHME